MTNATIGHNGGPDIDGPKQSLRTQWAKALFADANTPVHVMAIAWAIHWFSRADGTGAALSNEQLEAMCGISERTATRGKQWLRDNGYVALKVGNGIDKTRFRMTLPAHATQEDGVVTQATQGSHTDTPRVATQTPQGSHTGDRGSHTVHPRVATQAPIIQERESIKIPEEERASARPRQDAGNFWQEALNPQSAGVVFDKGKLTLLNGVRAFWLDRFEADEKRLDLALIQIAPALQPNSQRPLQAQVEGQLAKIVAERLDRDTRYARAATAKAASAPPKKPIKLSRW
jgi:hypothetical protein